LDIASIDSPSINNIGGKPEISVHASPKCLVSVARGAAGAEVYVRNRNIDRWVSLYNSRR
jgi:hypothetical protein